jgi:hypothetical protein
LRLRAVLAAILSLFGILGLIACLSEEVTMRYRNFQASMPGLKSGFTIIVDDESMTWQTEPPGKGISVLIEGLRFVEEGVAPIGSGKWFDILPNGTARETK